MDLVSIFIIEKCILGEYMLDKKSIEVIEEILKRGNTAEIRKRKNEVVILEIKGKVKHIIEAAQ